MGFLYKEIETLLYKKADYKFNPLGDLSCDFLTNFLAIFLPFVILKFPVFSDGTGFPKPDDIFNWQHKSSRSNGSPTSLTRA